MLSLQALSQAAALLPPAARHPLLRAGHFTVAATLPRLRVEWMTGQLQRSGKPARLLVAGEGAWGTYLPERLLRPGFEVAPLAHVRAPALRGLLARNAAAADLVCVRLDKGWARLVLGPDYLEIPEWVGAFIQLPKNLEGYLRANESRHSDVRRIRREGYTFEVSHAHPDLDTLHREFHAPFIQRRFGAHAHVAQVWLWHRLLSHGGVLWVRHQDRRVAGLLYTQEGDGLRLFATGCAEDADARAGFAGLYVFMCMHAHALGYRTINLGGCRPTLRDGVFRYKRKWGACFVPKPDQYFDFYLAWNRPNPALHELLIHTPLAVRHGDSLAWIAEPPADNGSPAALARQLRTRGIARTAIVSQPDHEELPTDVVLIPPLAVHSSRALVRGLATSRGGPA